MGSFSSKTRSRGCGIFCQEGSDPDHEIVRFSDEHNKNPPSQLSNNEANKNQKTQVFVEGYYIEAAADGEEDNNLMRTKSLTEVDLDELKGCLDLGFGFSYDEIPELCNTLPALELCYSMNQRFLDDHQKLPRLPAVATGMVANWRISSPGDHPEDVKVRLKYWAQAVACTVRLCS
ncbi:hypothetical protein RHGRI_025725 [Rhododendron griersonianum]|uniref:Uncharacterized protein n=1 Tax=Rhododendron griersonianum TaxID=479676 RepID=A0AAV6IUQ5_9ERIC|nr:hypothetical protein RHGRI_025725 [Rhododendron griersonianum]